MSYQVIFKSYEKIGNHIEYIIEITCRESKEVWVFRRRYSEIREWHEAYSSRFSSLPPFPPKKLFGNFRKSFLEKRKLELQNYFVGLLDYIDSPYVKKLLRPEDINIFRTESIPVIRKQTLTSPIKYVGFDKMTEMSIEKMIDLSDLNKNFHENVGNTKGFDSIHLNSNFFKPIVGNDDNLIDFNGELSIEGHWVRKKLRGIVRELRNMDLENLLVAEYY